MNKQIKLYSVRLYRTKTANENKVYEEIKKAEDELNEIKVAHADQIREELGLTETTKEWNKKKKKVVTKKQWNDEARKIMAERVKSDKRLPVLERKIKQLKKKQHKLILANEEVRRVDVSELTKKQRIAIFDNNLTRTIDNYTDNITLDLITVEVKDDDINLMEQLIKQGVILVDGETEHTYRFYTAGAGQIRTQKFVMMKEELWDKHSLKLMNGLTIDYINKNGGMNINKFLAYLALNNSASTVIEGFDIDKCIVVKDYNTTVENGEVDYIERKDKEIEGASYTTKKGNVVTKTKLKTDWVITRKPMDVEIPFMDGAGIMLPTVSDKNLQIRLPWIKGLLTPVDFHTFAKESGSTKVTDMYGKVYDIIEDDIQIIFTESQFKMCNYYKNTDDKTGWEVYQKFFKDLGNTANVCDEDVEEFEDKNINYQMLQTLTDMDNVLMEELLAPQKQLIKDLHSDSEKQLEFLGATADATTGLGKILYAYPDMMNSEYVQDALGDKIKKLKKNLRAGHIEIKNSKRTFLIPDVVMFMNIIFKGEYTGALNNGECYCEIYGDNEKLDILRSPHLSREHGIRVNTYNDLTKKYFITKGMYTSSEDLISKLLVFDNDGDTCLVVNNENFVALAEKQMEDIRPLVYKMGKAPAMEINADNIYKSLKFAFQKNNIGKISNALTDIWNQKNPDDYSKEIKLLCMYNNFIIDSAKTLEVPIAPEEIKDIINKREYPYFFKYAKDKIEDVCRPMSDSVMDRICKSIDNIKYTEYKFEGKFIMKNLLNDKTMAQKHINKEAIEEYKEIRDDYNKEVFRNLKADVKMNKEMMLREVRLKVLKLAKKYDISYERLVDMILMYEYHNEQNLAVAFNIFSQYILNNIEKNLYYTCERCGVKHRKTKNNQKYCKECSEEVVKEKDRLRKKK